MRRQAAVDGPRVAASPSVSRTALRPPPVSSAAGPPANLLTPPGHTRMRKPGGGSLCWADASLCLPHRRRRPRWPLLRRRRLSGVAAPLPARAAPSAHKHARRVGSGAAAARRACDDARLRLARFGGHGPPPAGGGAARPVGRLAPPASAQLQPADRGEAMLGERRHPLARPRGPHPNLAALASAPRHLSFSLHRERATASIARARYCAWAAL
eukprot:92606-Chlamydomonas_euryale.AAC.6